MENIIHLSSAELAPSVVKVKVFGMQKTMCLLYYVYREMKTRNIADHFIRVGYV